MKYKSVKPDGVVDLGKATLECTFRDGSVHLVTIRSEDGDEFQVSSTYGSLAFSQLERYTTANWYRLSGILYDDVAILKYFPTSHDAREYERKLYNELPNCSLDTTEVAVLLDDDGSFICEDGRVSGSDLPF